MLRGDRALPQRRLSSLSSVPSWTGWSAYCRHAAARPADVGKRRRRRVHVLALDNGKAVERIDLSGTSHQGAAIITKALVRPVPR
jgi:hypothetical protein